MTNTLYELIARLADGNFHSGQTLAGELGVSRSAVWSSLQQIPALGLELHAVHGRGYRLATPLELLDKHTIRALLSDASNQYLRALDVFPAVDSTSKYIRQRAEQGEASGVVCFAEYQSAGRGRRGRHWHSPYGSNLYLSLLWRFNEGMNRLAGLSLATAVVLMRCFNTLGANGLGIKWPNDIVSKEGKVAGILVDVAGESAGPCYAVVGIGINYAMTSCDTGLIDQPWSTLKRQGIGVGRNQLAATLIDHLIEMLLRYESEGFAPFYADWGEYDLFRDKAVTLQLPKQQRVGIARGIDANGLLLVQEGEQLQRYAAGEVSLRSKQG